MKYLFLVLLLSSCSASWHLKKAQKKGAEFGTEVIYKYNTKTDTIIDTLTNTVEIRTTLIDSFPYEVKTIKYVPLSRQERLKFRDSLKFERKNNKLLLSAYKDSLKYSNQITRLNNRKSSRSEKNAVKMERAKRTPTIILSFAIFGIICFLILIIKIFLYIRKNLI